MAIEKFPNYYKDRDDNETKRQSLIDEVIKDFQERKKEWEDAVKKFHETPNQIVSSYHGLTRREEFVKAAMQGLLSNSVYIERLIKETNNWEKEFAFKARAIADATIAELNKKP